jgi:hypothetical protein
VFEQDLAGQLDLVGTGPRGRVVDRQNEIGLGDGAQSLLDQRPRLEPLDDILPNAPNLRLIEHRRRQPMPQVLGIDHIAFAAHDLEATCVFYDQLFGARTHF